MIKLIKILNKKNDMPEFIIFPGDIPGESKPSLSDKINSNFPFSPISELENENRNFLKAV